MRFASKSQDYNRTVLQPIIELVAGPRGPEERVVREPYMAQFERVGLTAHEKEQCKARFTFLGQYEGEDPLRRVSIFDTDYAAEHEGWDAKTKAEVEQNLLAGQNEYYFLLAEDRVPAPWPRYDDLRSPQKIAETVESLGLDPESVIAYERENKNREPVIEALEALGAPEPLIAA